MLPYIILFVFCIIMFVLNILVKDKKYKTIVEVTTLVILTLFSGTRYKLGGSDYLVYQKIFNSAIPLGSVSISEYFTKLNNISIEPGFYIFSSIFKALNLNYYIFTLFHSIVFYSLMYKALKKYNKNFNFFIIIFLYKLFFYNTFISMRQSIALVIFWLSIDSLKDRKLINYILYCVLGMFFHSASMVLIPIYFIYNISFTKKNLKIIGIICGIIFILSLLNLWNIDLAEKLFKIIDPTTRAYEKIDLYFAGNGTSLNMLHTLELYIIYVLYIINYDKIKSNENVKLINCFIILILLLVTVFRNYEIITRVKDYFIVVYSIILSKIIDYQTNRNKLLIVLITISICCFGYFRFIINFDRGGLIPYESYIFKEL